MKNILFIVLDSITNDQLFNCINSKDKAPFLNKLRDKAITGDNMYSQAPYTEAALMSLLGSVDTLDAGGYMEKFKNKNTVIDDNFMLEIEKPQDRIFNQNGDFSAAFTHAYGQVLDFLSWAFSIKFNISFLTLKALV